MTDNQLLFEAAKAAGIDYTLRGQVPTRFDGKNFIVWNPLTNDGDALRLAVKLHLLEHSWLGTMSSESDPYAATRRAIVRAAAAIGKEIK